MRVDIPFQALKTILEADESDNFTADAKMGEHDLHDFVALELGIVERLPSILRYSEGMSYLEEIVLEQFGEAFVDLAVDIVFELIENKKNAGGIGDQGDCYAPW